MLYVGGYESYRLLLEDARAYDDVLIAMAGETDAQKMRDLRTRAGGAA